MHRLLTALLPCMLAFSAAAAEPARPASYFDNTGREDAWQGGVRMIPIHTPAGDFRVWTKRVGNNPRIKVLILHGGPGSTHEAYEAFDSFLPAGGVEYYYYDQLGSAYSDQPADMAPMLTIDRFVDEVEQVRTELGLDRENFYLYGHSWGGILAIEYALKHQQHLKGLVVSNMMSSVPAYNRYADDVLMPEMDPAALAEIKRLEAAGKFDDPRYMELLMPHYERHVLRRPAAEWPEPMLRGFGKLNKKVYVPMQGPSELGASGLLVDWDRTADLAKVTVPTLVIGAKYDTMDPAWMRMMAGKFPRGDYLQLENGSHMAMYDDQQAYFAGLLQWLHKVDAAAVATP
jgi:proline iminopeptidase